MTADDMLKAIYERSGKKYMAPVELKPLQTEFGDNFSRFLDRLHRTGDIELKAVGQVWLSGQGLDRAEQLFG